MVQAETIKGFCDTFGACGFDPAAFRPVYGLAETTLTATFSPQGGGTVDWVDRAHFAATNEARPARSVDAIPIVSVGRPIPGHELRVVSSDGNPLGERQVGEVWLRGPSLMKGYFNNPQATAEVLRDDGWLATGDLGYLHEDGTLYITGRSKDLIIKGGRNYLPQDFEAACLEIRGLRPGRTVAFGLANQSNGTEDIVIVAEVRDPARTRDPVLLQRVVRTVSERTGIRPDRIELANPGVLPKTTSGKLQRGRVKSAYEAGIALRSPPRTRVDGLLEGVRSAMNLALSKINRMLGWQ
jgi:acyl-CoA synthetase (AMP-forming)/AMP-acid ligase II